MPELMWIMETLGLEDQPKKELLEGSSKNPFLPTLEGEEELMTKTVTNVPVGPKEINVEKLKHVVKSEVEMGMNF